MKIFNSLSEWQIFRKNLVSSLGFVPTMGALHEGHLDLIKKSQEKNTHALTSIYVNPTQFNDPVDLEKYPRTLDDDIKKLQNLNVDFLLLPSDDQLYPDHYSYKMIENNLSQRFCGAHRPGHFDGMLTVVLKLLNLAQAERAYFGEKDFQQLTLIQGLVKNFFIPTEIISIPTVREPDGLALSSRNKLLSSSEREKATLWSQLLKHPSQDPSFIQEALKEAGFEVEYIEIFKNRILGAVRLGSVRLIDNVKI